MTRIAFTSKPLNEICVKVEANFARIPLNEACGVKIKLKTSPVLNTA